MYHQHPSSPWSPEDIRELNGDGNAGSNQQEGSNSPEYLSGSIFQSVELGGSTSVPPPMIGLGMTQSTNALKLSHSGFFQDSGGNGNGMGLVPGLGVSWDAPLPPLMSSTSFSETHLHTHNDTHPAQHPGPGHGPGNPLHSGYSGQVHDRQVQSPSSSEVHGGVSENDDGYGEMIMSPMTPHADGVATQRASSPFSASSAEDTDGTSQDQDQNYAAKAVYGALRVVGQTLAVAYEQIKLQNQIAAVKNMANYAGSMFGLAGSPKLPQSSDEAGEADAAAEGDEVPGPPDAKRTKREDDEDFGGSATNDMRPDIKEALKAYEAMELAKKNELTAVQSKIKALKDRLQKQESFLTDYHFSNRKTKKLHPETYEQLFFSIVEDVGTTRTEYFLPQHPKVNNLADLIGTIYFLSVPKTAKKPPQVGFPFRSYSDSHYTSVDRTTPIICKVKEWPHIDDSTRLWRLYHYYLGSKKKKRRNEDD